MHHRLCFQLKMTNSPFFVEGDVISTAGPTIAKIWETTGIKSRLGVNG